MNEVIMMPLREQRVIQIDNGKRIEEWVTLGMVEVEATEENKNAIIDKEVLFVGIASVLLPNDPEGKSASQREIRFEIDAESREEAFSLYDTSGQKAISDLHSQLKQQWESSKVS